MESRFDLNLNTVSPTAFAALLAVDEEFVGTFDYMGIAPFWASTYKFTLRDATPYRRKLIHQKLLYAGLDPGGQSAEHNHIIRDFA